MESLELHALLIKSSPYPFIIRSSYPISILATSAVTYSRQTKCINLPLLWYNDMKITPDMSILETGSVGQIIIQNNVHATRILTHATPKIFTSTFVQEYIYYKHCIIIQTHATALDSENAPLQIKVREYSNRKQVRYILHHFIHKMHLCICARLLQ